MAPARSEGLVLGVARDLEAVGVLVARLVAVRRRVPHDHLVALADLRPVQLGVAGRGTREVPEGGEHPQRLLHRRRGQRRVVEQLLPLVGVLEQRAHAAAVGRLGAVVAGCDEEEEAHHDLVLLQPLAVDLGVHQHAREVVGGVLAALRDQLAAAREDLGHLALHHGLHALGVEVRIARAQSGVHQPGPDLVVLRRDAHEAADHARHHRLCHVRHEVALVAVPERVEHPHRDLPDGVLVLRDPLRRESALEERLEPIVLGRVHPDEHRLRQLEREDRVPQRRDPGGGRVGLPVPAHRVNVVGRRDRPVAGLRGVLADACRPVDGALRAHPLEQFVGRSVRPLLALGHEHLVEWHGLRGGALGVGPRGQDATLSAAGRWRKASISSATPSRFCATSEQPAS